MDYKEKYEQALSRARQFSEKPLLEDSAGIVEYIFPELAENKDEKIRKALIHFFSNDENTSFEYWEGIPKAEALAWLEKQGEQKPFDYEHTTIQQRDFAPKFDSPVLSNSSNTGKVEPKFKIGDTIVGSTGAIYHITEMYDDCYMTDTGCIIMFTAQDNFNIHNQNPSGNPCLDCINHKGCINCVDGDMKETEKPDWSEEDEENLKLIKFAVLNLPSQREDTRQECLVWLESLKDRIVIIKN